MVTKVHKKSFVPPLWMLTLIGIALFAWIVIELKEMVVLLVVSFSISYVISPLLNWMERRGISRPTGVFVLGVLALIGILAAFFTAIPILVREYDTLVNNFPSYLDAVQEKLVPLRDKIIPYLPTKWGEALRTGSISSLLVLDAEVTKRVATGAWTTLMKGYDATLAMINLLLLPFLVFYLSVDYKNLYQGMLDWFPLIRRQRMAKFFEEIDHRVSQYVRGQLLVGFLLFLLFGVGLGVMQIELWLLIAFISGFGNIVPYVGSVVGVTLATIMTLVTYGNFTQVLIVWAIYGIIQFCEGTFITPKIIGESVGLSPLMVILALLAGGSLLGLLGVFLAVPTLAALQVVTKHAHEWAIHQVDH